MLAEGVTGKGGFFTWHSYMKTKVLRYLRSTGTNTRFLNTTLSVAKNLPTVFGV